MFRIGVCDDEAYFRQDIEKRLEAYFKDKPFEPEIHIFEKGQALLEQAEKKPFDLVFLDIEMPDMDGITLGEKMRSIDKAVFLIYVTSHQEFISQAMRLEISQFLIKPLEETFFVEEMDRVMVGYKTRKQKYVTMYKGVSQSISIAEILYLESKRRYVVVRTEDKDYTSLKKLGEEEERLTPFDFVRIHQSFLVNMGYITCFLSDKVYLKGRQESLPVSRKYRDAAKITYLNYQRKVGI